jgi:hypothetical protein
MSITFSQLGRMGRLGNQMFQYAALRGIAEFHGYHWVIPPSTGTNEWFEHRLFRMFKMDSVQHTNIGNINPSRTVEESSHCLDENLFYGCLDDTDIVGYLQSPKYFNHIKEIIKQDYAFKDEIKESVSNWRNTIDGDVVSIHIRRSDYVNLPLHHPLPPVEYYEKAISSFGNVSFVVISDDIEWCKQQEVFQGDNIIFPPMSSQEFDLCLMTISDGNIISNSTFSWWGAWLCPSDDVVIPSKWFGPALSDKDTSEYYVDGWRSI